ncbi:hypothetical protein PACTADRAFT_20118, partial [Pachysolen tannophilus NRRL Y-2460]
VSTIAIIKPKGSLSSEIPLEAQLQVFNLQHNEKEKNTFETLRALISNGISPYFDSLTNKVSDDNGNSGNVGEYSSIEITKKKLYELVTLLGNSQHNIQTPNLLMSVNPIIKKSIENYGNDAIEHIESQNLLTDSSFLNELQNSVNTWIKLCQEVTHLNHDPASGTAADEISFWISLEKALLSIQEQLSSAEVSLTLDVLKKAKRFHATVSFLSDTGINEALLRAQKYNQLLKDFPLDEILSLTSFSKLEEAVILVFNHLKKLRVTEYPISRVLPFVELISVEVEIRLRAILKEYDLAALPYNEFNDIMNKINLCFNTYDEQLKEFISLARELSRKRSEKLILVRINSKTDTLKEKIYQINSFRKSHEELKTTIHLLNNEELNDLLSYAYESIKVIDIYDQNKWNSAETIYNERLAKIEAIVIKMLKDSLSNCKNANEMFGIFEKFSTLLAKPNIRNSVQEYQSQLLEIIKSEIQNLSSQLIQQKEISKLFNLRDLPPVTSMIIWAKQVEKNLNFFSDKLQLVLGDDWKQYPEGQKLYAELSVFKNKLDVQPLYESWLKDSLHMGNNSENLKIFKIIKVNNNNNNVKSDQKFFEIVINFDYSIIDLFKEVKHLSFLKFNVPHSISLKSRNIRKVYPKIISLSETLSLWNLALQEVDKLSDLKMLMDPDKERIIELISGLVDIEWGTLIKAQDIGEVDDELDGSQSFMKDLYEMKVWNNVNHLEEVTLVFYANLEFLNKTKASLIQLFEQLAIIKYDFDEFSNLISEVQKIVDEIILKGFTNVGNLVSVINEKLSQILTNKCIKELDLWYNSVNFDNSDDLSDDFDNEKSRFVSYLKFEMIVKDQTIMISPMIESAKVSWLLGLQKLVKVILDQKKITSERFDVFQVNAVNANSKIKIDETQKLETFSSIIFFIARDIERCLNLVDFKFKKISKYLEDCFKFQSLWELQIEDVVVFLGEDVESWILLLNELKESRDAFDTVETSKSFGYITIDYEHIQFKVTAKYDIWQRQIALKFSEVLNLSMKNFHSAVLNSRKSLEKLDYKDSIQDTISLISNINRIQLNLPYFEARLKLIEQAELLLVKNRFRFGSDWLTSEQVHDDFFSLIEIFDKRSKLIEGKRDSIISKINSESLKIEDSISTALFDWSTAKPVSGNIAPAEALKILVTFENKLISLKKSKDDLVSSSKILGIDLKLVSSVESTLEEISDLKNVWNSINELWETLANFKTQKWIEISPLSLHRQLDDLLSKSRSMPLRIRQYTAFEGAQDIIKNYIKANTLVTDLKSAMKLRHWQNLFKSLNKKFVFTSMEEMTLGDIWDLDILANEGLFKNMIIQAYGEKSIEDKLNDIKETWKNTTFDLFNYHDKCRLVKNWDVLFQICEDNLNSLTTMRHSPYYLLFEQEASLLEEQLNKMFSLLDIWIEVQKEFVYIDGVFGGNSDVRKLLPLETSRFSNISSEFFLILKSVYKSAIAIDSLTVSDIHRSMERTLDVLIKIRRSLSDYLEQQRDNFPRFYFVGNEDLLEIIGNSNDLPIIAKHFKKMFAGIADASVKKETGEITHIISEEGEHIELFNSVQLKESPPLHEWLAELELETKITLSKLLENSINEFSNILGNDFEMESLVSWMDSYPSQICIVTSQVCWTKAIEAEILGSSNLDAVKSNIMKALKFLAKLVNQDQSLIKRRKFENLIIEFIHQKDIITLLVAKGVNSIDNYSWRSQLTFYYDSENPDYLSRLIVRQANSSTKYGFEYLGVPARLAYTPLIDKCILAMTQALNERKGGSPFGPAGTGKTETIKFLSQNLGKMVYIFNFDESFQFSSISRILLGICQVGAWGCFDEFNRLDEKMLSAVSTQIEKIELGLSFQTSSNKIELLGKQTAVHPESGIFVTMNPGYAGRSTLPENLKKLFRSFSMNKPDREVIAEVVLNSQGFTTAASLAKKIVPFFSQLEEKTSRQTHYDFGVRALKSTLIHCGINNRKTIDTNAGVDELLIVLKSLEETIRPKLTSADEKIFTKLEDEFFGLSYQLDSQEELISCLKTVSQVSGITLSSEFIKKVIQLYQIQSTHHGIMLVGEAGVGKSTIWKTLLSALDRIEDCESIRYIIDCKVITKDKIYGSLDPITRDWTDGIFTHILRRIAENLRGESSRRTWIIFDGDIDPEWVESLNSVLDDNKILTLPNGERISLPPNVRLIFEVDTLRYATPATVSRCGIVFIGNPVVNETELLSKLVFDFGSRDGFDEDSSNLSFQNLQKSYSQCILNILKPTVLSEIIAKGSTLVHYMDYNVVHTLTMFQMMSRVFLDKIASSGYFDIVTEFTTKAVLLSLAWAFAGDSSTEDREMFSSFLLDMFNENIPGGTLFDYTINLPNCDFVTFFVPEISLEKQELLKPDLLIPTTDTVKHEELIYSIIHQHKTLIMCGPPGSGKTMTLFAALRKSPDLVFVDINFSKETTPELLLKTLEQYCDYKKLASGTILAPKIPGKWLVIFADELNLPKVDKFNSQKVISFMRELVERGGFYKSNQWIHLKNVQFVGACNPPSDPGRHALSMRFLRNTMVISVNYPNKKSLCQIYNTLMTSIFRGSKLIQYATFFSSSIIDIYLNLKSKFTEEIFSPRDITRVIKSFFVYLEDASDLEKALRILLFNLLRVFSDRMSKEIDRIEIFEIYKTALESHFPNISPEVFKQPLLYSNWFSMGYEEVKYAEFRSFVSERLRIFCEEETDVPLVLYDELLDHVLRIDRVLRQPQGHMILIGTSTSGKTTLAKFVSWVNGLKTYKLLTNRKFSLEDFDQELRDVLVRVTIKNEKLCFIVDESNILETAFLERMNNLLSNCEIPGLFDEEEIKVMTNRLGLEESEFTNFFKNKISENLHVIFTISDSDDIHSPRILSSPALLNRCAVNWMGDWSNKTLYQVATSLIHNLPVDMPNYSEPASFEKCITQSIQSYGDVVVDSLVFIHRAKVNNCDRFFQSPGTFLDFTNHFSRIFMQKEEELQNHQKHINVGLDKLRDAVLAVRDLKEMLSSQKADLETKDKEARSMLNKMLSEQNEAERKEEASIEIQTALEEQEKEVTKRRAIVMEDLAAAEPAVLEAQRGVKNIKKEHLNELKAMRTPPEAVVLTLKSVCDLIGYNPETWRDIQSIIRSDSFIVDIVNFDNERQCTQDVINYMHEKYLSRPDYNYTTANRASKACGPLLQWVEAQIRYASILEKVGPLRDEVHTLENEAKQTKVKLNAVDEMIRDLRNSIEHYKDDYSSLIRETEQIKTAMSTVVQKVRRSEKLIEDLTGERERWRASVKEFHLQRKCLVGNSLLSAAFLSYCGYYDQKTRFNLLRIWKSKLMSSGIAVDENYVTTNYLSTPSNIIKWEENGTPNDDLFIENMIMLTHSQRFPYIIDPSGKMLEILTAEILPRKLIITSFLDDGFVKKLENALRFGSSILIQDAEKYDPIISQILSKEVHRTGGRTLMCLGKQEIDCTDGFKLYLYTRDPSVKIPPFVSSRTTTINFTVTASSLEAHSLNMTLKKENPEIEEQRLELIKIQGEYKVHLRKLEDQLLKSLTDSNGNILDNDEIINTLEILKHDSTDISKKMEETSHIMEKMDSILVQYYPLASSCSSLYIMLDSFKNANRFYQFSLGYFVELLTCVLNSERNLDPRHNKVDDLVKKLYQEVYSRTALSLLHEDRVILCLTMFALYFNFKHNVSLLPIVIAILRTISKKDANVEDLIRITNLMEIKVDHELLESCYNDWSEESFKTLIKNVKDYDFIIPLLKSSFKIKNASNECLSVFTEVSKFFLENSNSPYGSKYSLSDVVLFNNEHSSKPIVLCSPEGYDATFKVESIKQEFCIDKLVVIAMGSNEAIEIADKEINKAAKEGYWVLIQNVQMSNNWLEYLQKNLESLVLPHRNFRLFLTCSLASKLPITLLRESSVLIFENSPGIKSVMLELFVNIPHEKLETEKPIEKKYLYFLLCWFHAVLQERLRFVPIGFNKYYEFNNTDFELGIATIDKWVAEIAKGRTNVAPEHLPWEALQILISEIVYGAKVDIKEDLQILIELSRKIFRLESFDNGFNIIEYDEITSLDKLFPPEIKSVKNLSDWIRNELPDMQPPTWLGLNNDVELKIKAEKGRQVASTVSTLLEQ